MRWFVLATVVLVALRWHHHAPDEPLRFATFNIEEFPKDAQQIAAAFDEIARADVGFIAVEEIHDGRVFAREAARRLGEQWRFVQAEPGVKFDLGVLYDSRRFWLKSTRVLDDTRVGGNNKPAFEVRLKPIDGGATIRVIVIHFRCCTEGRETRAAQYVALERVLVAAKRSRDRITVMGDFNATEDADRTALAHLAAATGMVWASEPLACTAFWSRDDGCPRSRLDHVLTWDAPTSVVAGGACATEGCDWQASCPLYADEVSDHCPVIVSF
jgi:endonuclease/exonuclease/phosphatase family metal-dependent hydrolase